MDGGIVAKFDMVEDGVPHFRIQIVAVKATSQVVFKSFVKKFDLTILIGSVTSSTCLDSTVIMMQRFKIFSLGHHDDSALLIWNYTFCVIITITLYLLLLDCISSSYTSFHIVVVEDLVESV